jgi:hypothetical protein
MSAQIVLLPVFVLVGLTLAFLLVGARAGDETKSRDIALSQSALPLLFYTLIVLDTAAATYRSRHRAAVLGVRGDVLRAGRRFRSFDRRSGPFHGIACGRAGAFCDVDLLRAEDLLI